MVKRFDIELDNDYDTDEFLEKCRDIEEDGYTIIESIWVTPRFIWVVATTDLE